MAKAKKIKVDPIKLALAATNGRIDGLRDGIASDIQVIASRGVKHAHQIKALEEAICPKVASRLEKLESLTSEMSAYLAKNRNSTRGRGIEGLVRDMKSDLQAKIDLDSLPAWGVERHLRESGGTKGEQTSTTVPVTLDGWNRAQRIEKAAKELAYARHYGNQTEQLILNLKAALQS